VFTKQVLYLALMVCVPLSLLAWLGFRFAQQQEVEARERYRDLQVERLHDIDQAIMKVLAQRERELLEEIDSLTLESDAIRAAVRSNPHISQVFVLSEGGQVLHPPAAAEMNSGETQFLTAFGDVLLGGDLLRETQADVGQAMLEPIPVQSLDREQTEVPTTGSEEAQSKGNTPARRRPPSRQKGSQPPVPSGDDSSKIRSGRTRRPVVSLVSAKYLASAPEPSFDVSEPGPGEWDANNAQVAAPVASTSGWYTWYWGRGLNLILWSRRPEGEVVGVLLQRARWMADVVAALPETSSAVPYRSKMSSRSRVPVLERVHLADSSGGIVYQWGRYEPPQDAVPFAELALSLPLSSWRLHYFMPPESVADLGGGLYFSVASSLVVVTIGLVVLAIFIYREQQRNIREAGQRVNFVNQVSHELKTPLTNVRMYAELLESDLAKLADPDEAKSAQLRLSVIVSESQRLSRLIGNVLTFARDQRKTVRLHPRPAKVDDVVSHVADQFQTSLARKNMAFKVQSDAAGMVLLDSDALEQILVNLLSNVEKYAGSGSKVTVTATQSGEFTSIVVADDGPGLAAAEREKIFQPFYRGTDRIEGATGTGIGLSIARQLARLHGGDLTLLPAAKGARFEVRLRTPVEGSIPRKRYDDGGHP